MAIAHISSAQGAGSGFNNTTSATATLPGTVDVNDLLIVAVATTNGAGTISLSDNQSGNTYTGAAAQRNDSITFTRVWYCTVVDGGAGFAITATLTGNAYGTLIVHRVTGQDLSAPLDKVVANTQASPGTGTDAVTSTAQTPTTDGQYIFGFMALNNFGTSTTTAGTGFTAGLTGGPSDYDVSSEYLIQGSAASVAATFTLSANIASIAWLVTFKAAATGRTTKNTRAFPLGVDVGMNWRS